jgi:hypothetical protein
MGTDKMKNMNNNGMDKMNQGMDKMNQGIDSASKMLQDMQKNNSNSEDTSH